MQSFTQRKEIEEKEVEKERQGLSSAEKNIQELKEETNQLKHKVHEINRNMEVKIRHNLDLQNVSPRCLILKFVQRLIYLYT